jgi:excinuclease UvrABC nuclease subunit
MSDETAASWSEWLDFNENNIDSVPEVAGVYMMHAAMKILYIGDNTNLRQGLRESLSHPCISKAKRFRYLTTQSASEMKEKLLNEYRAKHGRLPSCMET